MLSVFFSLTAFALSYASSNSILSTASQFFEPRTMPRVGIEVEFQNLDIAEAAKILQKRLGGKISTKDVQIETTIKELRRDGTKIYHHVPAKEYYVTGTRGGDFILKLEINMLDDTHILASSSTTVEIVGPPQRYDQVALLDEVIRDFKMAGARGTDAKTAVSIQVNMELYGGDRTRADVKTLLALMRNYLDPKNKPSIEAELSVPEIRRRYVQDYTPGFMQKLMNPSYEPSWEEFFDDFFLRQSAEVLEIDGAWTKPAAFLRDKIMGLENPVVPRVIKQNRLRVSSILLWMFPQDSFSVAILQSGWARDLPIVEFREANNDFDVLKNVKRAVGLKNLSDQYGHVPHEAFRQVLFSGSCAGNYLGLVF